MTVFDSAHRRTRQVMFIADYAHKRTGQDVGLVAEDPVGIGMGQRTRPSVGLRRTVPLQF